MPRWSLRRSPRAARSLAAVALLAGATVAAPSLAQAQTGRTAGAWELGIDAGISTDDVTDATVISIPVRQVRVGYFVSPRVALEPSFALDRISGDGGSITQFNLQLGVLGHLTGTPRTTSLYVRPFAGLQRGSASFDGDSESVTQTQLGAGLGLKFPVLEGRLAWRVEGLVARSFETDDLPASTGFGLTVGLSFFPR